VPILWDKKCHAIVNNESAEIIRMFNSDFNVSLLEDKVAVDLYPEPLCEEIDGVNDWVSAVLR
jgi:putative glutathione S-transferase